MQKFEVLITETLSRAVVVEAENEDKALYKVRSDWKNEIHVLDSEDFLDVKFEINHEYCQDDVQY